MYGPHDEAVLALLDELGLEDVPLRPLAAEQLAGRRRGRHPLVEDLGLGEEADHLVAELGLQGVRPALVLLEPTVEALPAGGRQLVRSAVGVDKGELLELVR